MRRNIRQKKTALHSLDFFWFQFHAPFLHVSFETLEVYPIVGLLSIPWKKDAKTRRSFCPSAQRSDERKAFSG